MNYEDIDHPSSDDLTFEEILESLEEILEDEIGYSGYEELDFNDE